MNPQPEWKIILQTMGDAWLVISICVIVFFIIDQIKEQRGDK